MRDMYSGRKEEGGGETVGHLLSSWTGSLRDEGGEDMDCTFLLGTDATRDRA